MGDISHAMEIESADEEAFDEPGDLSIVMGGVSLGNHGDKCCSKRCLYHLIKIESFKLL